MSKIIFISQILLGGGAERVVSLLSQEFSKQGHSVKIVLFSKEIGYDFGGEIIDMNVKASNNYIKKFFALFK